MTKPFHIYPCDTYFIVRYDSRRIKSFHLKTFISAHPNVTYSVSPCQGGYKLDYIRVPYHQFDPNCIVNLDEFYEAGIHLCFWSDAMQPSKNWDKSLGITNVLPYHERALLFIESIKDILCILNITIVVKDTHVPIAFAYTNVVCLNVFAKSFKMVHHYLLEVEKTNRVIDTVTYGQNPRHLELYPNLFKCNKLSLKQIPKDWTPDMFPNLTCLTLPGPLFLPRINNTYTALWDIWPYHDTLKEICITMAVFGPPMNMDGWIDKFYSMGIRKLNLGSRLGSRFMIDIDVPKIEPQYPDLVIQHDGIILVGKKHMTLLEIVNIYDI
jgi:hypothetical protein